MSDDEIYKRNVERLFASGSTELISNNVPAHAAVLLACFLRNASDEVKIFCNRLRREVYDSPDVLSALVSVLQRGTAVQVISRYEPEGGSEFLKRFEVLAKSDRAKYSIVTNGASRSGAIDNVRPNFAVADRRAFRFEAHPENCKAIASMNQPELAGSLAKLFDRLCVSACTPDEIAAPA